MIWADQIKPLFGFLWKYWYRDRSLLMFFGDIGENVMESVDTIVIGAGQAGLSISYHLTQQNHPHLLLEKDRIGEVWRSQRWDSFGLILPNWTLRLSGHEYDGDAPDGFLARDEIVEYLERYASKFNPPVRLGVEASSVEMDPNGTGFLVRTKAGDLQSTNVVVTVGSFQKPKTPPYSRKISSHIHQIHSSQYRNPGDLPKGAILVVGSAQSGSQIAKELYQSGRRVYMSVGRVGWIPRSYRGRDAVWWMERMGMFNQSAASLPSLQARFVGNPYVASISGGRTVDLFKFAEDGVTLLGHINGAQENEMFLSPDLNKSLANAREFAENFKHEIDKFIHQTGLLAPQDDDETAHSERDFEADTELNLLSAGIKTVIWGTGYSFDFSWIKFPILDEYGYPVQQRGVTSQPGLYFVGLNWMHQRKSGLFLGVGEDAAHVAGHLTGRRGK
jgi:putative flavoprotein involved in K+ transport